VNYPIVQIGDLALDEPGSFKIGPFGSSLKKGELVLSGIPVIGIENILPNKFVPSYRKYITEQKYQDLAQYTVRPGDIAVTTMGTIGRAAVIPEEIGTAIIDSHLFRMRVDQAKVYPPYLCYAINDAPSVINHLEQMSRGAIMDGLNTTILKESPLALPPLPEQKRIASLLARADRLRQLRQTAHDLGDELLQSVFLEMFGDPVRNEKWWEVKEIQDVVVSHDSKRVPLEASDRAKRQGKYPYYGATGIIDYIDDYIFDQDMLLIAEDGKNLLNRTKPIAFMATGKYWVNNHSHVVASNGKINLRYLEASLNIRDISPFVTGIDQFKLNRANLDVIPISIPPLNLQEEFAGVVARVEGLRARMSEAERQAEGLFESLLAQSFSS
jgi:type I restriction enzyme, S subunit